MRADAQQAEAVINGQSYKVEDCVLFQHGDSPDLEVGRITAIVKADSGEGQQQLSLVRFLQPEQVLGGRQPFHGDKELIESDDILSVPLSAVRGRARVYSLEKFQLLQRVGAQDYFARLGYRVLQEEFVPQRMPVFCACEMPYNPDKFMVQCSSCHDWYHPECLQCSIRALGARSTWTCPGCSGAAPADGDEHLAMETGP